MNQNEVYSTFDFPLATTLYYLGFSLEGLENVGPAKVSFNFKRTPDLDETIAGYWRKELKVEPAGFLMVQRELKSRIYSR